MAVELAVDKGYVTVDRTWKKGDEIQLERPMQPRIITARNEVKVPEWAGGDRKRANRYSLEGNKNPDLDNLKDRYDRSDENSFESWFVRRCK
jgi:hypothetical protein